MDSKFLLAEVQACCSALGYLDNGVYHKGEDHLNAIKVSCLFCDWFCEWFLNEIAPFPLNRLHPVNR